MKLLKILGVVGVLALTGCASFQAEQVAPTQMPSVSQYQERPGVYVDFRFYQGRPGAGASELPQGRELFRPQLEERLRASGLFSHYTLDAAQKKPDDYVLRLSLYNHGSSGAAAVSGFISGFSLGIIPATAKDEYTLTLDVLDPQNQPLQSVRNDDSIRTWIGWIFLPVSFNTINKAVNGTFGRQVDALLKQTVEGGKLRYAMDRLPPRSA